MTTMQEIKTTGLVLNSNAINDNDKIFTLLTRDAGKVTALSKGIRSHKHKDFSALQNFCLSEMVLKPRGGMCYIASAEPINTFFGIRGSVEQVSFATYITDIIRSLPDEELFEDEYFSFILNTLYLIGKAQEKCRDGDLIGYLEKLKAVFEFKTVCSEGFMPDVERCRACGSAKDMRYFDLRSGNVLCKSCGESAPLSDYAEINQSVHKLLMFLCAADLKTVFAFNASEENLGIVSHIAEQYLINTLEIFPASLTYLKNTIYG